MWHPLIYKKAEIAMTSADQSTSKFRLDVMNIKRDLLSYITILKHTKSESAEETMKQMKNDLHLLNVQTYGETYTKIGENKNEITNKIHKNGEEQ